MIRALSLAGLALAAAFANPQSMPVSIRGEWRISKILPTPNDACWDNERAKTLVNSTLRYAPGRMTWKGGGVAIPEALTRTLTTQQFQDEYKFNLAALGIHATSVVEVDLQHDDADITGATTEVPGDTILLAGPGRIVVSACGVYFSAVRVAGN
jgi:hypothetical protein